MLYSEEDLAIRDSVARLCETEIPKYQNDQWYNTVPLPLWQSLASLGLGGLSISADQGGLQASPATTALVMETIARFDLGPAIFTSVHSMVSGLIDKFGTPEQKERYLPAMARGEMLGAFALTEPDAGSDAANLKMTAVTKGDGFVLRGNKCYISSAGYADLYLVFAKTGGAKEISCFIVDGETPGLAIGEPEKKMGCELSPIASLFFEDALLPADALLGPLHKGFSVALSGLDGGRVNIAACANGVSITALEKSISHVREREQFGEPLASFQGIQFMVADMFQKLDAARLLTWKAAKTLEGCAFDDSPFDASAKRAASAAKCFATDAAMSITTDAVQLLGGAGYIKDYTVERLMREAKMLQIVEGTNQIQRIMIARALLE